jgi:hypothetical protein
MVTDKVQAGQIVIKGGGAALFPFPRFLLMIHASAIQIFGC